jgi:hypothetical protein
MSEVIEEYIRRANPNSIELTQQWKYWIQAAIPFPEITNLETRSGSWEKIKNESPFADLAQIALRLLAILA